MIYHRIPTTESVSQLSWLAPTTLKENLSRKSHRSPWGSLGFLVALGGLEGAGVILPFLGLTVGSIISINNTCS